MTHCSMLIVGYGTMAGAMVDGWLAAGRMPADFEVYHPSKTEASRGLTVHNSFPDKVYDVLLLGVKPNLLDEIAAGLEPLAGPQTLVISIMAGVERASLSERFPRAGGIIRFMPNLAVALGKSPNALFGPALTPETQALVTQLAQELGTAEWLDDETQFDLVTALAGSGPGFVYRFIDALASGATQLGLDEEQAQRLAVQMVEGAAALAASSQYTPAELAQRVASPGGMTQKGLDILDADDALAKLMRNCLAAARDRGLEMATEARRSD